MGMSGAAITYLVERMIASGHFRRESDPSDRRKVILRVADDGIAVARGFFTPLAEHNRRAMAGLPDDDLAAAHRTFTAIIDAMRAFRAELDAVVTSSISSSAATVAPSVRILRRHGGRRARAFRGSAPSKRRRQRFDRRRRAVVCGPDAEVGHPARPVGLVRDLGNHHLGAPARGSRGRRRPRRRGARRRQPA